MKIIWEAVKYYNHLIIRMIFVWLYINLSLSFINKWDKYITRHIRGKIYSHKGRSINFLVQHFFTEKLDTYEYIDAISLYNMRLFPLKVQCYRCDSDILLQYDDDKISMINWGIKITSVVCKDCT